MRTASIAGTLVNVCVVMDHWRRLTSHSTMGYQNANARKKCPALAPNDTLERMRRDVLWFTHRHIFLQCPIFPLFPAVRRAPFFGDTKAPPCNLVWTEHDEVCLYVHFVRLLPGVTVHEDGIDVVSRHNGRQEAIITNNNVCIEAHDPIVVPKPAVCIRLRERIHCAPVVTSVRQCRMDDRPIRPGWECDVQNASLGVVEFTGHEDEHISTLNEWRGARCRWPTRLKES